ncbi:MAG: substrate-binding domain-containing protein, partial [Planctomycetia bacterium]
MTASRALQVLRDKGIIHTVERSGCYLVPPRETATERWALCIRITPGPFYEATQTLVMSAFAAAARRRGIEFDAAVVALPPNASERDVGAQVRRARQQGVRGLFLLPSRTSDELTRREESLLAACRLDGLPVVLMERNLRGVDRPLEYDLSAMDDLEGGRALCRHLLSLGRRRLAVVVGSHTSSHRDRVAGCLHALCDFARENPAGAAAPLVVLEPPSDFPGPTVYTWLVDQLTAAGVDGVVCYQDYVAVGVILEALRRGVRVPADLAVAGFDDLPIGNIFSVGVTTYAYPGETMALAGLS